MRLRPRSSGTTDQDVDISTHTRQRAAHALGDISNRINGNDSKNNTKQLKNIETSAKTKTIQFDDSENINPSKPRRSSARLQQIREREQENNSNNSCTSSNANCQKDETEASKTSSGGETAIEVATTSAATTTDCKKSGLTKQKQKRRPLKNLLGSSKQKEEETSLKRQGKRRRLSTTARNVLSRTKKAKIATPDFPIVMDQHIREDEDKYIVHPDFRLQRAPYNRRRITMGEAKHDRQEKCDVLQAAPYVADMFQHHFELEGRTGPGIYMTKQSDINSKMRAILVDWLVEVHMKFRLVPETLYLCINIIDRYCSIVKVKRAKLQLVGVTALLIACKYEEIYPPEVRDCVYITDSAYQRDEVLDMEQDIVHKLGFRITVPTAYPFLQRFLNILKASATIRHASSYYTERTLQEHDMLRYRPSLICAAAVTLALNNPDVGDYDFQQIAFESEEYPRMPLILLEYTGFTALEVIECAEIIAKKVSEEPVTASRRQLVAVKRKYENRKYLSVSQNLRLPSISSSNKSENES